MRNLHTPMSVISDLHSSADSQFAAYASRKLEEVTGKSIRIYTLNSGDTTEFECEEGVGDVSYLYQFENGALVGIFIQSDEYDILKPGIIIEVDEEMTQLYRTVMACSYLLSDLTRNCDSSDEELRHIENWQDAI